MSFNFVNQGEINSHLKRYDALMRENRQIKAENNQLMVENRELTAENIKLSIENKQLLKKLEKQKEDDN